MTNTDVKKLIPGKRVDGARHTDLSALRARRSTMREARTNAPPVEDTRVAEVWARQGAAAVAAKRNAQEDRRIAKLVVADGLKDGSVLSTIDIKISASRTEKRAIRCRPGTFEWRYGRNTQDALYHAGNHFALLWEKAGTAAARSPSLEGAGGAGWKGLPDGRAMAIDLLNNARTELGRMTTARLIDYCVSGLTSAEIAKKHDEKERDMAPVLNQDLRACAFHFKFL